MATPKEKLATSLEILHDLQKKGKVALRSEDISRTHRERLVQNGFLEEISRGWYIITKPKIEAGDSTSWFSDYWRFCAQYYKYKFGNDYFVSADQSLLIHAGNTAIPSQLIVKSPKASNTKIDLIHQSSFFEMKAKMPEKSVLEVFQELNIYSLASSLVYCSSSMYKNYPNDVNIALSQINDASDILTILLENSHTILAGKLAGAFRYIKRSKIADDILYSMRSAGHKVLEVNPFDVHISLPELKPGSAHAVRIESLWDLYREIVVSYFPESPGLDKDPDAYLKMVDDMYQSDAYHSLSIENYSVTTELIEKVRSGRWNMENDPVSREQMNAMAARGYWLASKSVKKSIRSILEGGLAGEVIEKDHGKWYKELFSPSVQAGIISPASLAGYRIGQVYISRSRHVPMNKDAARESMPVYFNLLKQEKHAGVRAILGHFFFVYIHPYMDGNGRMARFLMNAMLASGGYPWTIIPVESRNTYMNALEQASVNENINPFSKYISELVESQVVIANRNK